MNCSKCGSKVEISLFKDGVAICENCHVCLSILDVKKLRLIRLVFSIFVIFSLVIVTSIFYKFTNFFGSILGLIPAALTLYIIAVASKIEGRIINTFPTQHIDHEQYKTIRLKGLASLRFYPFIGLVVGCLASSMLYFFIDLTTLDNLLFIPLIFCPVPALGIIVGYTKFKSKKNMIANEIEYLNNIRSRHRQ